MIIKKIISYFINQTVNGFNYICLVINKGFFFYFCIFFETLEKKLKINRLNKVSKYFKNKQSDPNAFLTLVVIFLICLFIQKNIYVDNSNIQYIDKKIIDTEEKKEIDDKIEKNNDTKNYLENEINLYRKYSKLNINDINISDLKQENPNIVSWLMVDGTNVNYPIVQTTDNEYYLNHDITNNPKASGWTFMDFRNDSELTDKNTIFYGHNLLNKTAFGSLDKIFTDSWFNNSNHYIMVKTENNKYLYEIFSNYYIDPEIYYLQNNFNNDSEYQVFLKTLKDRSIYNYNVDVSTNDTIITLSTCTDDNKGRKVVHARRIIS